MYILALPSLALPGLSLQKLAFGELVDPSTHVLARPVHNTYNYQMYGGAGIVMHCIGPCKYAVYDEQHVRWYGYDLRCRRVVNRSSKSGSLRVTHIQALLYRYTVKCRVNAHCAASAHPPTPILCLKSCMDSSLYVVHAHPAFLCSDRDGIGICTVPVLLECMCP